MCFNGRLQGLREALVAFFGTPQILRVGGIGEIWAWASLFLLGGNGSQTFSSKSDTRFFERRLGADFAGESDLFRDSNAVCSPNQPTKKGIAMDRPNRVVCRRTKSTPTWMATQPGNSALVGLSGVQAYH